LAQQGAVDELSQDKPNGDGTGNFILSGFSCLFAVCLGDLLASMLRGMQQKNSIAQGKQH